MFYDMTDGMPPRAPEITQRPQVQDGAPGTFGGKAHLLQNGMKTASGNGYGLKLHSCKELPSTQESGFQGQRGGTGMGLPYNGS